MRQFRLPWIRARKRTAPELPLKAPIQLGAMSNGEVFRPRSELQAKTEALILERAEAGARRLGLDRREFLASSMGMATSLWAINLATGCGGGDPQQQPGLGAGATGDGGSPPAGDAGPSASRGDGGYFTVPDDPADPEAVCETMLDASQEFIFDIQTHHVRRANDLYTDFLQDQSHYTQYCGPGALGPVECFDRNEYVRLMFLESDTTVAVLSGLPAVSDAENPITNDEIAETRDIINMLADGTQRLINHHMVLPNQGGTSADAVAAQLEAMQRTQAVFGSIGAWKCYPAWSPNNSAITAQDGWFLDDEATGIPFIQQGIALGVDTFCIHKGLPIPAFSTRYNDPRDVGVVAKRFPQAKFIVYHSGYGNQNAFFEGPYQSGSRRGVDSLITTLRESEIGPGSNVFAELGTTWQLVTTTLAFGSLDSAAHLIGKLLLHVGEDNVVWGTDSIWYGSPQAQIEMFLQFEISEAFQQRYGYPALTMERKRKILGRNAARAYDLDVDAMRCAVTRSELAAAKRLLDEEAGGRRWACFEPPLRTRRDFFKFHRRNGYRPG